ncbi:E3 ubiquitin-protein ligase makorin-1, partial [Globisporangium splendens]
MPPSSVRSAESKAASASPGSSRTPCSFFALGKCRNGANCSFYHAPREDLAVSPLPCKFFLQNACKAGRECKFSHSPDDSAQVSSTRVNASTGEKTITPGSYRVPCKFFKNNECTAGDKCPYLHQTEQPKPKKKPVSTVKMHVLNPKPKPANEAAEGDDEHEEKAAAWTNPPNRSTEDLSEQHMSDFLTKEEELFYYGAPGEFVPDRDAAPPARNKPSYSEVAKKNAPIVDDGFFFDEDFEPAAKPKTCTFFLQGLCRYGDSCFYMHALNEDVETEQDMVEMGRELQESMDLECNICYDNILQKEERFGLLSGCNHAFCLTCVRNWRGNTDQPKQMVRQCPVCRVETHFIIPSSRMVTSPERKKVLIETYRKNLSGIPCRHFNEGQGTCPFGTSCFYAHRYPDGTLDSRQVRTAVDADGHYDVLRQVRLENFFQQQNM